MGLLDSFLDILSKSASASKPFIKNASSAVAEHVKKNSKNYKIAAGGVVAAGGAYALGKSKGHREGKKEGTAQQAQKDEAIFQKQHQAHEKDRAEWKKMRNEYEDLLDKLDN